MCYIPITLLRYGAYSVTVSTKHFDCFSLGSNPSKPTIIRVVEESGLSRWPWTLEHAGSNPAYPTNCPLGFKVKHDTFNIGKKEHYLQGVQ